MAEVLSTDGLHFVGKTEELIAAKRTLLTLEGRDVLIIHHQGEFYAIDSYCYHAGTSLQNGDIEELDRKVCIICPKHKYKISLSAGEGVYRGRDRSQSPPPLRWFSKGLKQRVHRLSQIQGALYLRLNTTGWMESDYYQGERGRVEREKAAEEAGQSGEEEEP
ncbi:Rieske domain-containing protein [Eucyclogobius newberryi]|uniref:Rieske domain-containing protein-like n=1 Tax=Eucyclogobius newberryi TaxID=166745 RepID=UPI003B5ADCFE